jgi:hypothetical protein
MQPSLMPKTALQKILGTKPIVIYPSLATIIGVTNAICWQQLNYWVNKDNVGIIFEGRRWIYNTYDQWCKQLPFFSERTIRRAFSQLEKVGLIITRRDGDLKYYTVDEEAMEYFLKSDISLTDIDERLPIKDTSQKNKSCQNVQGVDKMSRGVDKLTTLDGQNVQSHIYNERARVSENTQRVHRESSAHTRAITHPYQDAPPSLSNFSDHDDPSTKKKGTKKGTYLSESWCLPDNWREWSVGCGMFNEEIDMIALKFKNHWLSTNKNALKKDWFKTWQNWCIGEYEKKGKTLKIKPMSSRDSKPHHSYESGTNINVPKTSSDPLIQKWYDRQQHLVELVGKDNYVSWLDDLEFMGIKTFKDLKGNACKEAIFRVRNKFIADHISIQFLYPIFSIVKEVSPEVLAESSIKFVVRDVHDM